ncbi:MAG TPA: DUF3147 family protein [Kofleriaceae bacterium]|nr:DUF3147 family protein [Kofleriaceae bacterium]
MSWPRVSLSKLRKVKAWEYVVRFAVGGSITAVASIIASHLGPANGGMFLAFPAILPASLTLVKQHDGRHEAIDDARGGRLASIALACFAFVVTATASTWPAIAFLVVATIAWAVVAVWSWRTFLA